MGYAVSIVSANKHSIPIRILSIRPAALMRGPSTKPKSWARIEVASRPAISSKAKIPTRH